MRTRVLTATAAAALAAAGMGTSPLMARADTPGPSDVVAFVGSTTALSCATTGPASDPSPNDDGTLATVLDTLWDPVDVTAPAAETGCPTPAGVNGLALVGGGGNYSFTTTVCEGLSLDDTLPFGCSFTSTGSYENIVCGTGEAEGNPLTLSEPDGTTVTINEYDIFFVAGLGVVTGNATESDSTITPAIAKDNVIGLVQLGFNPLTQRGDPTQGICVTGFTVVGVAAVLE